MKTPNRAVGRPPAIEIIPNRLRQLRESKGWTQTDLAKHVSERRDKRLDPASLKNIAHRWERDGKLSLQTATILADVLGVTLSILRGAEPDAQPSRIEEIKARIHEQLATGNDTLAGQLHSDEKPTDAVSRLAQRLAADLEYAQLSQDAKEFQRLSQLLGYRISELQQPASAHGHWILICNGPTLPINSAIIHGTVQLMSLVERYAQECLDFSESDMRVTLTQDSVWFRIQFPHPRIPELAQNLSFARCQPSATGLLWTKPTWMDDYFIQKLPKQFSEYANYVNGFDLQELGPSDLANLKLAIYKLPTRQEIERHKENAQTVLATLTQGCLNEYLERLPAFVKDGSGHDAATSWLCADLLEIIQPLMGDWPLKHWQFQARGNAILVSLDAPPRLAAERGYIDDLFVPRLRIELVESLADTVRRVPWRLKSVEHALERIKRHLNREIARRDDVVDPSPPVA
ncbi:helix-turn-helix domain-containing protein [Burkholderia sp. 22PA0106]|uniref:helix-turn-helix domain-containing protein n=1 Tax=Burkholderia sp. 22PA0106 TaxID=3237371 RepID=UPI0039C0E351